MISVINEQQDVAIDTNKLKQDAQDLLTFLDYADFDLGILLTTNEKMQCYNRDFRGKDKPTDILSFPHHSHLKAGKRIVPQAEEDKNLGDIIIAPEYIKDDLERWNMLFEERMQVLLVHGVCHLLGYDHIKDIDYELMQKKEHALLKQLKY